MEVPLLRGAAIWEAADVEASLAVVPNPAGRIDAPPRAVPGIALLAEADVPLTEGWAAVLAGPWPGERPVSTAGAGFDERTRAARHLAGALRQVPGVDTPNGRPDSPRFILRGRGDGGLLVGAIEAAGVDSVVARGATAGLLPGSAVVEIVSSPDDDDYEALVAAVRSAGVAPAGSQGAAAE